MSVEQPWGRAANVRMRGGDRQQSKADRPSATRQPTGEDDPNRSILKQARRLSHRGGSFVE